MRDSRNIGTYSSGKDHSSKTGEISEFRWVLCKYVVIVGERGHE
jgi:hypothetical protein